MTPEQQRIAIAEACGWKVLEPEVKPAITYLWGLRKGFIHEENREIIPNYLFDLNAMQQVQEVLTTAQMTTMSQYLHRKLGMLWVFSTAAQRAEAFLRTIGKWKEAR